MCIAYHRVVVNHNTTGIGSIVASGFGKPHGQHQQWVGRQRPGDEFFLLSGESDYPAPLSAERLELGPHTRLEWKAVVVTSHL